MIAAIRANIALYLHILGSYGVMLKRVIIDICTKGIDLRSVSRQVVKIGNYSLPIVILTAVFTGMVLALQTAYGLHRFGAKNYVGNIVGLGLVRELGPVLTAIMVCGRVGAGIAAEIGSMAVTEQIDAIRALGADPIRKLVSPRIVAGLIALPALVVIANVVGIYGGMLISVFELDISAHVYYQSLMYTILIKDVLDGLIKSAVFGFLVISIACYSGINTSGGTEGVGKTTTRTVVAGSILIFISDFFITKFLFMFG